VAEIILGTIAMESLGPLVVSAVVAALTIRVLTAAHVLYRVPAFQLNSPLEMGSYVALGLIAGTMAPWFLRSLRQAEQFFLILNVPVVVRLALGGFAVGVIAINVPQVAGNGYSVVVDILNGRIVWVVLVGVLACKWLATMASFGSGAPGGVFTPSLFMGASAGYLFGSAVHSVWPAAAQDPRAFALVGMGAFLSAASHAPVMAVILLFEMTLSYDIILPLMMASVVAYYTAKGLEGASLYSESLTKKSAEAGSPFANARVGDLARPRPRCWRRRPILRTSRGCSSTPRSTISTWSTRRGGSLARCRCTTSNPIWATPRSGSWCAPATSSTTIFRAWLPSSR
jgi:CIC family chloride channel protein